MTQDLVSLHETLRQLESAFGYSGAILQVLQALRSGELIGICAEFRGRNASVRPIFELPDKGQNLILPKGFWGQSQWLKDGETISQSTSTPFDPWVFNSDWRKGNFCVSGSTGRGAFQIMRQARSVRLQKDAAEAFLIKRGVKSNDICVKGALATGKHASRTQNEIASKMLELMDAHRMSRDEAAKALRTIEDFESVTNDQARRAVSGLRPRGRPKNNSREK